MIRLEWEDADTVHPQYVTERYIVAEGGISVDDYVGDAAWLLFVGGSGGGYALGGSVEEIRRVLREGLAALDDLLDADDPYAEDEDGDEDEDEA